MCGKMALFYALLCLVLYQILPIFAINKEICRPPSQVLTILQDRYNVKLYKTNISIVYDFNNTYVKMLSKNIIELSLNTATVSFKGFATPEEKSTDEFVKTKFDTKPIVIHHIQDGNDRNCRLESSENFNISLYLEAEEVEAAIIQLTEHCIESYVCEKFNSIIAHDYLQKQLLEQEEVNSKSPHPAIRHTNNRSPGSDSYEFRNESCADYINTIYDPQRTINAMIDFGVAVLMSKLDTHGVVEIPEIHTEFSTGASFWRITGDFTAAKGSFEDLRNIQRIKNIVFMHENLRFSASSTYRLTRAKLKFGSYKVRYGKITVSGEISVDIDYVTVSGKATFDFNNKPCVASLNQLDIDELSEIKVSLTGLGILNGQVSNIISGQIKSRALDSMRTAIAQKLNELNCETFRPR